MLRPRLPRKQAARPTVGPRFVLGITRELDGAGPAVPTAGMRAEAWALDPRVDGSRRKAPARAPEKVGPRICQAWPDAPPLGGAICHHIQAERAEQLREGRERASEQRRLVHEDMLERVPPSDLSGCEDCAAHRPTEADKRRRRRQRGPHLTLVQRFITEHLDDLLRCDPCRLAAPLLQKPSERNERRRKGLLAKPDGVAKDQPQRRRPAWRGESDAAAGVGQPTRGPRDGSGRRSEGHRWLGQRPG
eukprot:scaffold89986_cov39-Phaeocystis_antarctica.AAC.3